MSPVSLPPLIALRDRLRRLPFNSKADAHHLAAVWREISHEAGGVRWLCCNDRFYLLYHVLRRPQVAHPWLYARCREVEADTDGYLDIWPREHWKSSIVTFAGSIQEILNDQEITIGLFSHNKPIAKAFLSQIKRELESNEILKAEFPDILYENPEKQSKSWSLDGGLLVKRSGNPKEMTIEAHGLVDGQPTSRHFLLLLYDDVVTLESVNTPEQIGKTTHAWEMSDNLGVAGGRKQMVGTRYHFSDTYAELIARKAIKLRLYTATHNGEIDGEPVLFTREQWAAKKLAQSEPVLACQMLGNPLAGKQRMFDIADLCLYEVRPDTLNVYILIDPARSVKKDSDHTAMVVLGIDYAGNKYLLDGFDHKMDLSERWKKMAHLWAKWRSEHGVQMVSVGYERFGAIADLDYFEERMGIERIRFDIVPLEWPREGPGSKRDRVQRLTPDLKLHRLYLPYPTNPEKLTSRQRDAVDYGCGYRVSPRIRKIDENRELYDLTERLKEQLGFFPFANRVDVVDALSRIYDLDPTPPTPPADEGDLEPDVI